jgi:hypothetical protein
MRNPSRAALFSLVLIAAIVACAIGCGTDAPQAPASSSLAEGSYHVTTVIAVSSNARFCSGSFETMTLQISSLGGGKYELTLNGTGSCESVTLHCDQEKTQVTLDGQGVATNLTPVSGSCTATEGAAPLALGVRTFSIEDATSTYPGTHETIAVTGGLDTSAIGLVFTQ